MGRVDARVNHGHQHGRGGRPASSSRYARSALMPGTPSACKSRCCQRCSCSGVSGAWARAAKAGEGEQAQQRQAGEGEVILKAKRSRRSPAQSGSEGKANGDAIYQLQRGWVEVGSRGFSRAHWSEPHTCPNADALSAALMAYFYHKYLKNNKIRKWHVCGIVHGVPGPPLLDTGHEQRRGARPVRGCFYLQHLFSPSS